jgi:hypothetical protein
MPVNARGSASGFVKGLMANPDWRRGESLHDIAQLRRSMRAIAASLGRAPSTISREIRRNETMRTTRCHTRPSIGHCLSKPVGP